QVLRPATVPIWLTRQSRAGDVASTDCSPAFNAESAAPSLVGSKMNARSLLNPSPLMSPEISGVNGVPLESLALVLTVMALWNVYRKLPWIWLRESLLDRAHSRRFGSAAVLPVKPRC